MTNAELLALLRDCYTPLTQQNIVVAGLVRSATLKPDADAPGAAFRPRLHAHITLNAPTGDETANAQLSAQIENRLLGLEPIARVTITLLPTLFPIL